MQATAARLHGGRCLEVLWVLGHCGLTGNELNHRDDTQMPKPDMTHPSRFRSGHHLVLRRWQRLSNRSDEATCRICNDGDGTYDHLWLRYPAFDADHKSLDLGVSIDELTRFPSPAQALLRIILRRLR